MRHDPHTYTDASGRRFLAEAEAQDTETFAADYARNRETRARGQRRARIRFAVGLIALALALVWLTEKAMPQIAGQVIEAQEQQQ